MTLICFSVIQRWRWALIVVQSMPQTPSSSPRSMASMISAVPGYPDTSLMLAPNTFL